MTDKNNKIIQDAIIELEDGRGDIYKVFTLLILIRYLLPAESNLREICHFVSNPEINRGNVFEKVEQEVKKVIKFLEQGGVLRGNLILETESVLKELLDFLCEKGIVYSNEKLIVLKSSFVKYLFICLDETTFKFSFPEIMWVKISCKPEPKKRLFIFWN
jgi:hypothetical protein